MRPPWLAALLLLSLAPLSSSNPPSTFPSRCTTLDATSTDPSMRWYCQGPYGRPEPDPTKWGFRTCTNLHLVCLPPAASQPQLVIFLPGTGLGPMDYTEAVIDMSSHGFHAIGLQYPSTQGQNGCDMSRRAPPATSSDLNCTARERHRVLTGEAVSYGATDHTTNITAPDSIVNRVAKALLKLGTPWTSWLLDDGRTGTGTPTPDWSNIIISGHSNGADHAAFLAKTFNVSRALTLAGANDMVDGPNPGTWQHVQPAPWQFPGSAGGAHATPPSRFYGFGVCGTAAHKAEGECYDWHAGWLAQEYPGPWFRADAVLADATGKGLAGYHKLCSNGSLVGARTSNHMASAGDCCVPRTKDGAFLWTNVYKHMLMDPIGTPPPAGAGTGETCGCAV